MFDLSEASRADLYNPDFHVKFETHTLDTESQDLEIWRIGVKM